MATAVERFVGHPRVGLIERLRALRAPRHPNLGASSFREMDREKARRMRRGEIRDLGT